MRLSMRPRLSRAGLPQRATALALGTAPPALILAAGVPAFTVEAQRSGSLVTAFEGDVTLTPSSGVWGGTLTRTAVAGVATFNDVTPPIAPGRYTFTLTANGYAPVSCTVVVPVWWGDPSVSTFSVGAGSQKYTVVGSVAGDTQVIAGVTFTAVASGATGDQWNASSNTTTNATNLKNAINAAASMASVLTAVSSSNTITLTRVDATADTGLTIGVGGANHPISATNGKGQGDQYSAGGPFIRQSVYDLVDARGAGWLTLANATALNRPSYIPNAVGSLTAFGNVSTTSGSANCGLSVTLSPTLTTPLTMIAVEKIVANVVNSGRALKASFSNAHEWSVGGVTSTKHGALVIRAPEHGGGIGLGPATPDLDAAFWLAAAVFTSSTERAVYVGDVTSASEAVSRAPTAAANLCLFDPLNNTSLGGIVGPTLACNVALTADERAYLYDYLHAAGWY